MSKEFDNIRAAAEKATKGKRYVEVVNTIAYVLVDDKCLLDVTWERDLQFEALTDPTAIIAMCDALDAKQMTIDIFKTERDLFEAENKTLRNRIEQLEKPRQYSDYFAWEREMKKVQEANNLLRDGLEKISKGEVPINAVAGLKFIASDALDKVAALKVKGSIKHD